MPGMHTWGKKGLFGSGVQRVQFSAVGRQQGVGGLFIAQWTTEQKLNPEPEPGVRLKACPCWSSSSHLEPTSQSS